MNRLNADDRDDFVSQVVEAFEQLPVLSGPGPDAIAALLEQAAAPVDAAPASSTVAVPAAACSTSSAGGVFASLSWPQQVAIGGLGLSTAVGLVLLFLALTAGQRLSAMERLARELREVTSYSYRLSSRNSYAENGAKQRTVVSDEGVTYWMVPDAWHSTTKIVRSDPAVDDGRETVIEHFAEVFPAGKAGLFIDYQYKTYRRIHYEPIGSTIYPLDLLRMIRDGSGDITHDLGTKEIAGRRARGYTIVLKGWHDEDKANQVHDPVDVWVDAETDLPLEFGYRGKHDTKVENATGDYWLKATDFRWNVSFDPQLFVPTPPADFVDITPPDGEKELQQIGDALRLFAEFDGGHYPQMAKFDAGAVHKEMLKLGGFSGPSQPGWHDDKTYQRIVAAKAGLDWIERILRNRYHAGYDGRHIGPSDKDKTLLWWAEFAPEERYRVYFGDLRSASLSAADAEKLGLPEAWREREAKEREEESRQKTHD